ncbi:ABC transporter permease [Brevundimonas aurantiaca]|uniref:ABC transporter permease n=1 Tax=Brevundimonas aurantiaca TaxID=74316 RepID=UPI00174B54D1|nr:ABC transporter permease [Brevundimonas aurantiaca]
MRGGVALALTAACRSREQAQPLTTFVALLLAALGGSMAPRFLMPEVFRTLGWITPHAWAVETYQALIWRGEFSAGVLAGWAALGGVGLAGLALAVMMEQRRAAR